MSSNILQYLEEVHICPHCNQKMSCCHAPAIHVGDGLGWGAEVLFICLNDYCSLFLHGWERIEQQYGHHASYRYMELPQSNESNVMMVGNADAYKASVVDPKEIKKQSERYQKQKEAARQLDTCVAENNLEPVLSLILDESADVNQRKRAISLLVDVNDLACIDPIRNHSFRDSSLEMACNQALAQLLKNNYQKECPSCGDLVKMQARKCKHCSEEFDNAAG